MIPRYHVNPYDAAIACFFVCVVLLVVAATVWAWAIELGYV